jgi:hypothetical protein
MSKAAEIEAAKAQITKWREHPSQMVRELFSVEPDPWQEEALEAFPNHQRMAFLASKGPGKTACLSWLAWNFLLTRSHPKIAATSITGDNLSDGLWTEMAKWLNASPLLQKHFIWTKTRIFAREHSETWWMAARTWPQSGDPDRQADTLAGLHADYILFIIDESGGVPTSVLAAAEAALATGIEAHIVQAGNPISLEGSLYAAHSRRRLWHVIEINGDPENPQRSKRISLQWATDYIAEHGGRDDPWVMVNVLGKFPASSLNALLTMAEVEAAMERRYTLHDIGQAALVLGVDVARFGDDKSSIVPRRGIQCFQPVNHRGLTSTQGAAVVARLWDTVNADGCLIDNTGGFGSGWIDNLHLLGKAPIGIGFAEKAHEPGKYYNKRAEMYWDAAQWIKRGGALPPSREIKEAMVKTNYTFKGGRLLIEPKEDVKLKLGYSPDEADGFVLSFAEPISAAVRRSPAPKPVVYEPFTELDTLGRGAYNQDRATNYDPYRIG